MSRRAAPAASSVLLRKSRRKIFTRGLLSPLRRRETPQSFGQNADDQPVYTRAVLLIGDGGGNHRQADRGQRQGQQQRILEQRKCQVAEVPGYSQRAEHGEYAPIEEGRNGQQSDVDQAINELGPGIAAVYRR